MCRVDRLLTNLSHMQRLITFVGARSQRLSPSAYIHHDQNSFVHPVVGLTTGP
jgi:hypothetical protein